MIDALIAFALRRRWLVLGITLLIAGYGLYNLTRLNVDAVPDITMFRYRSTAKPRAFRRWKPNNGLPISLKMRCQVCRGLITPVRFRATACPRSQ